MISLRPVARVAMDLSGRQSAREHVDGARRVERARREDVDQQKLPLGHRMHGDMAIVVQQRGSQTARLPITHGRDTGHIHSRRARGGDDQPADQRAIAELVRRHPKEIGDDVLVIARQARQGRRQAQRGPAAGRFRARSTRNAKLRPRTEWGQAARWKAPEAISSFRAPCTGPAREVSRCYSR